ncbi:MAG: SCP2 sterol-binding domain-containing protein, partial [Defluviitaleaceae bacterium]|nr:SCP2 sterol-binding domain-containing protein [Defluviitaleaceae bacterium]
PTPQITPPQTVTQETATPEINVPSPAPIKETARQQTAKLVHLFQPQLSKDLNCKIQLSISGEEAFEGFIAINGTTCNYHDGQTQNPTLLITADDENWSSVATGKLSAQKAFMTGQIKIKGNYVLLMRFDQIFKFNKTN